MADHQIRHPADIDRMVRGGGQRDQDAVAAERFADRNRPAGGQHDLARGAAEQPTRALETIRAGHEDIFADSHPRIGTGVDDPADRFVTGDQRITHSGKARHPPGPQQLLGARGHAAPVDLDPDVAGGHRIERERPQR